jgi:holo-[acyl-carrier protein] synthase
MILGTGVDLVEVERISSAIERHGERFVGRIFTEAEAQYCRRCATPEQRFATRFAAKEAVLKALGVGWQKGVSYREVEVSNDELGAPAVTLTGRALEISRSRGIQRIHVSLTHHRDFAIAHAVAEGEG